MSSGLVRESVDIARAQGFDQPVGATPTKALARGATQSLKFSHEPAPSRAAGCELKVVCFSLPLERVMMIQHGRMQHVREKCCDIERGDPVSS